VLRHTSTRASVAPREKKTREGVLRTRDTHGRVRKGRVPDDELIVSNMMDAMWDAIASTTPTVSHEDDRRRAVYDDENDTERGMSSPSSSTTTTDGVSAALTMRADAEREADAANARNRGATERPSARARCARREPKRAVLSDAKCVPVVRFGSVDVGETGREWLEIENDTASTQVRRGEPRTRRARRERGEERYERFERDDPHDEAMYTHVHDTRRIAR